MKIKCRSLVSEDCYEGKECKEIYGEDAMSGDGTWNGDSVVCDACYLESGAARNYQATADLVARSNALLDGRGVE
jgi:hypothetical protein